MLRLALRDAAVEAGAGVTLAHGVQVALDARERTTMGERAQGATRGRLATGEAIHAAADLHAVHHFTAAAAVDGSLTEDVLPRGGLRRRVSYGVWEGARGEGYGSAATIAGLWGASIAPDSEIADAEMAAVHAYLHAMVQRSSEPGRERVLIMSDCLGVLDALESAWRAGDARGLRTRDRGAMLESCCVLRAQLGLVVFMYVPAHSGIAPNAMADAAAKAHLDAPQSDDHAVRKRVTSRPVVYEVPSDFGPGGVLRPPGAAGGGQRVVRDRRLFPEVRKRTARWLHLHLLEGLHGTYVDAALVGRRWHASDARTYSEVTQLVLACDKLDCKEEDPVERMREDTRRVQAAMIARKGDVVGVRGAQDAWPAAAARREAACGQEGAATRHMAKGCAACSSRIWTDPGDTCSVCDGWRLRTRARTQTCPACGGSTQCRGCGGGVACDGWHNGDAACVALRARTRSGVWGATARQRRAAHAAGGDERERTRRRLGPVPGGQAGGARTRWVGFAGLAQTTVERLLREGGEEAADTRASAAPAASTLATARHTLGGECAAADAAGTGMAAAAQAIRHMQRLVVAAGGRASALLAQLEAAHAYAGARRADRAQQPAATWHAFHRVAGGDLEAVDWPVHGALDEESAARAVRDLADALAGRACAVGAAEAGLREAWRASSAAEVEWRDRQEAGRGVLRVCLRAWREVTDKVCAGAAKWAQEWAESGPDAGTCALARRLAFRGAYKAGSDEQQQWQPGTWACAFVLTWMRLVRAGAIRSARTHVEAWVAAQAARRRRLAESVSEYGRVAGGQGGRDARAAAWADQRRLQQERDATTKRARREGPAPPGGLGAVGATERMHTCVRGCGRLAACVTAADLAPRRRKRAPAACYWGCPGLCAVCSGGGAEGDLTADAAGSASGSRDDGGAEGRGADEAGAGEGLCGSCDEDGGESAAADGGGAVTHACTHFAYKCMHFAYSF